LKVAWLVSNYPNSENPMAGSFHQRMAEAVAKLGVTITVFALTPYTPFPLNIISNKWKKYSRYPRIEIKNGVKVIRPRYFTVPRHRDLIGLDTFMFVSLKKELLAFAPDLIDAHYAYPFGTLARKLKLKYGIPYILSLHGSDVNVDPFKSQSDMNKFKMAIAEADKVKVVSDSLSKKTKDLTGRTCGIINIGLDIDNLSNLKGQGRLKKQFNIPETAKIILYAGSLSKNKGVDELYKIAKNKGSENLKFVLIGDGPLYNEILSGNHVFKTGKVSPSTVIEYMFESDIFILPSLGEGMPTVLVEAGAVGIPIIATRVGGIPNLLGEGERGWLIENNKSNTLHEKIDHLLLNYNEAKRKAALLKKYVFDNFDVNKNAEKVIKVYQNTMSRINDIK
jgi:teichuronic acid biosynthesis glycosyltransferase TuaC